MAAEFSRLRLGDAEAVSIRKWVLDNVAVVLVSLPNLAITLSTVTVFALVFHWSGLYATLAYLIGQVFSVQYSVLFNSKTKTTLKLGRFGWSYGKSEGLNAPKEDGGRA